MSKVKKSRRAAAKTEVAPWTSEFNTLRRQNLFQHPPADKSVYPLLREAIQFHNDAFNAMFGRENLIQKGLDDIGTKWHRDGELSPTKNDAKNDLRIRVTRVGLDAPEVGGAKGAGKALFPWECRERHITYRGRMTATMEYTINNGDVVEFDVDLGRVPIMVRSNKCHIEKFTPAQLVEKREDSEEQGGYFIINGIERVIRLLQVNKRNFPIAIDRKSFTNRGPEYTTKGVAMRCVRPDETSITNTIHLLQDGNIIMRFAWRKREYLVPVMMIFKALVDTSDREIFEAIVGRAGSEASKDARLVNQVEVLLRTFKTYGLYYKDETRAFLGSKFRGILGVPNAMPDAEAGSELLRKVILVHLGNTEVTHEQNLSKFTTLAFMCRKLYALGADECSADNVDVVSNQDLLLGGFLFSMIIKERIEESIGSSLRMALVQYFRANPGETFTTPKFRQDFPRKIFAKVDTKIGQALEYFLSTGNLSSVSGLDQQQASGFTIVAEKLNYLRYLSHFRSVHRGAFFTELRTTTVRKLTPESWGFLCPVHTPDGSPCGLLNHLAHKAKVLTESIDTSAIPRLVQQLGADTVSSASTKECSVIMLDGEVLGWCTPATAKRIHDCFRHWKVEGSHNVPLYLEIGYIPPSEGGAYPGLYMASRPSRMVRPVKYLPLGKEDYVGPTEQAFMGIAVVPWEIDSGYHTHVEFTPTNIMSILANMTPFSDHNQSPRNMYQCQMAKQTMGTPTTALDHRTDNKMYHLQTGQTPVVRSSLYNQYGLDNWPNGMNAVVAVISYTAYDMDDAMIINKSAFERGFGYGTIYKTLKITLKDDNRAMSARRVKKLFGFPKSAEVKAEWRATLDDDGLPLVGTMIKEGDCLAAWHTVEMDFADNFINTDGETHFERYKDTEVGYIDQVRLIGSESGTEPLQTISVKIRIPRAPQVGDKFSSRHGQKGVLSRLWPTIDMPFSETGMQPDVIINPHAFPSRMTIGNLVEVMAGKSGALNGMSQNGTPWIFDEKYPAKDHFGEQLRKAGYNYCGNEPMYSGITGEEFSADIYIGVVYYQRLRHMVNDKFQVRTTGPIVPTTGQPVKGRKRHGGVRVGEMEKDALLAHGGAFLLQDRLINCSDYTRAWVCKPCGSFLSVQPTVSPYIGKKKKGTFVRCRKCAVRVKPGMDLNDLDGEMWEDGQGNLFIGGDQTTEVVVPGALKFLDAELAAMGVKLKYTLEGDKATRKGPARAVELKGASLSMDKPDTVIRFD
ncbi:probable DNA-directed RNA polymerase I 135K chain UN-18 [Cephalotrichum gorgonifer]|uniref:DNA-directed RNA polymerase subunit beta n=1 Tax=Cephalotrichum gorgonifer TaxID=2041049 RepID=A0AAE8MPD5_9PEZI|nr:probable DNA-directed RNA polymerase I 135K chain UN-18 [Cephalotrichum gorgonifer]